MPEPRDASPGPARWHSGATFIKLMFKLLNKVVCASGRREARLRVSAVVLPALSAGMTRVFGPRRPGMPSRPGGSACAQ
jgi:hypothetical protein